MCGKWWGRRSRRGFAAPEASFCGFGGGFDGDGEWDGDVCGAAFRLFLDEPLVSELLLRRSLLLFFLSARDALDDACLAQAESTVLVTFC